MTLRTAARAATRAREKQAQTSLALHFEIVKAYDGGKGMTPTQIAEVAGISRERVHQIVKRDKTKRG